MSIFFWLSFKLVFCTLSFSFFNSHGWKSSSTSYLELMVKVDFWNPTPKDLGLYPNYKTEIKSEIYTFCCLSIFGLYCLVNEIFSWPCLIIQQNVNLQVFETVIKTKKISRWGNKQFNTNWLIEDKMKKVRKTWNSKENLTYLDRSMNRWNPKPEK